jgi:hypothetical protein
MSGGKFLEITDAYEIIRRKMLINRISKELLQTQIRFSHVSAQMQLQIVKISRAKIKLINKLDTIMEKQLTSFTKERQAECLELYNKLNELDTPTDQMKKWYSDLEQYKECMTNLLLKIQQIENQIPKNTTVTNYKIKPKDIL